MKAILISIKPKWCAKIMNGEKTIEVRKTMPKCDLPIDVYIYCTKGKPRIVDLRDDAFYLGCSPRLNGKVVAKFTLNKVEEIKERIGVFWALGGRVHYTDNVSEENLLKRSCLLATELDEYFKGKKGYAIHISDLEIFNRPKELSEFKSWCNGHFDSWKDKCLNCKAYRCDILAGEYWCDKSRKYLTKAPQNFAYVEVE